MKNELSYSDTLINTMDVILIRLLRNAPNELLTDINVLKDMTSRLDAIILILKELLNEKFK